MPKTPGHHQSDLPSTWFAILGSLAVGNFSTFALAKQMRRNAQYFWPRAKSNLYAVPKRLVEEGLAEARAELVGERPRTVYSITDRGRESLASWLGHPPAPTRIESEMLVKMHLAPYGAKADLLNSLREHRKQLTVKRADLLKIFREYVRGEDPYPDRVHVNVAVFKMIWDYSEAEVLWADWAIELVTGWPDASDPHDRAQLIKVLQNIVRNAEDS